MVSGTAKLDRDETRKRRDLLIEILDRDPEKPIFKKALDFYRRIFLQNPDLIVCMSRKSWCVIHLFLPFLEEEGFVVDKKKLTHDRMVHPWFAELDQDKCGQIKVFVIDDTVQTGRALDKCVQRLKWVYKIDENNLTVAVFAMAEDERLNKLRIDTEANRYTVYPVHDKPSFRVNWGGGNIYPKEDISAISYFFVEALHACSEPYVGYIPAFRLPIEDVQKFLGAERGQEIEFDGDSVIRVPGYLEQDDLKEPLNDSAIVEYYNITNHQMRQHDVEAFYFSLPNDIKAFNKSLPALDSGGKNDMPFIPPKHALSIAALRFYLNRNMGYALIVPYLSLKDCHAEADIVKFFPEELRPLMRKMCSSQDWPDNEGHLAAYRLLRFASAYLWGKYVFKNWFGRDVEGKDIVSRGGIYSDRFFAWLDGTSAEQDLTRIWAFFDPQNGYVVEETPEPASLEEIIHEGIPAEDEEKYKKVIMRSLSVSADPVDYFSTASMIFRYIFTRDRELQHEHELEYAKNANKDESPFVKPFHGFPIHTFFALLLLNFPKLKTRRDVLTTVTLMLCDMGVAVTQICQRRGNIIGTVLFNGEQSCHALAPIAPEYAHFLSELPGMLRRIDDKEKRQKKFEMAKTEIRKYFEDEINQGKGRHLSLEELMSPLEDIRTIVVDDPNQDFIAYSVLPRSSFFDCSELFFTDLREKLNA